MDSGPAGSFEMSENDPLKIILWTPHVLSLHCPSCPESAGPCPGPASAPASISSSPSPLPFRSLPFSAPIPSRFCHISPCSFPHADLARGPTRLCLAPSTFSPKPDLPEWTDLPRAPCMKGHCYATATSLSIERYA